MPESRKRPGHPYHKPADISSRQRVTGRVFWALLFGIFGFLISYFGAGANYAILIAATAAAVVIGYLIGKRMEKKA